MAAGRQFFIEEVEKDVDPWVLKLNLYLIEVKEWLAKADVLNKGHKQRAKWQPYNFASLFFYH